jgi:diaminopimelate epimerase
MLLFGLCAKGDTTFLSYFAQKGVSHFCHGGLTYNLCSCTFLKGRFFCNEEEKMVSDALRIPFWKMSGSGNDFIVIDHRAGFIQSDEVTLFVSKVCRRGLSVGADGVILVEPSEKADYRWRYFNADGGEASMCGNGARCVARFASLQGIAPAKHLFETARGLIQVEVLGATGERVRVQMPAPSPIRLHLPIDLPMGHKTGHFVDTGVPHLIYFEEDLSHSDLMVWGKATRFHSRFMPEGTNVNFVKQLDSQTLKIRTYERGVEGETLACGTGSVAAALIATALGKTTAPVAIYTQGGATLTVSFSVLGESSFTNIQMEGDATLIYKGVLEPEAMK